MICSMCDDDDDVIDDRDFIAASAEDDDFFIEHGISRRRWLNVKEQEAEARRQAGRAKLQQQYPFLDLSSLLPLHVQLKIEHSRQAALQRQAQTRRRQSARARLKVKYPFLDLSSSVPLYRQIKHKQGYRCSCCCAEKETISACMRVISSSICISRLDQARSCCCLCRYISRCCKFK